MGRNGSRAKCAHPFPPFPPCMRTLAISQKFPGFVLDLIVLFLEFSCVVVMVALSTLLFADVV